MPQKLLIEKYDDVSTDFCKTKCRQNSNCTTYDAIGDCLCLDLNGIKLFEAKSKKEEECTNLTDPSGYACQHHKWKHTECFLYKEKPAVQHFNESPHSIDCSTRCDNEEYCRLG